MSDLSTTYLGLRLANPLIAGASPLSRSVDHALKLEDAGAAALVMFSLFEEDIIEQEENWLRFVDQAALGHGEADSFLPEPPAYRSTLDRYVEQLSKLKQRLSIPVIASLNGVSREGWLHHARKLEEAGADALELNVYYLAGTPAESAVDVEQRYLDLLATLRAEVNLPIAMKLSPQFSALPHFVRRLEGEGANGVVLFNRFYQPDIDLDTLKLVHEPSLSRPEDVRLALHWIAILRGRVHCSIAASGGVHSADEALRMLLVGADAVQMCSTLLQHGASRLRETLSAMQQWLEEREYDSVAQLRGSLSEARISDPGGYERVHYRETLHSWESAPGVWR
ncbi:dihydroorotate dehydrogenase-like protein [Plasticicumulans acidivorans]|uniref:Dihydroorotate dehydrogenase (Fumarate) n=1 Tax=Plasticicumulans acidivorans TaxID=886464 RepID=A0A317MZH6_9GAMM|nr:dihydroorotate dehydrogenase-like protein [Plasticicumulans acidivorans]PWV65576.1 dihydroorotate dehydrogenase (fumarate) [Plasticicumulans acidivorans]